VIPGYCLDPFENKLDSTTIMYKTLAILRSRQTSTTIGPWRAALIKTERGSGNTGCEASYNEY
jgi:hypothetical protein